jgi:hypothetical protein
MNNADICGAGQGDGSRLKSPSFPDFRLAQVAQSVEQRTENPRVGSSILSLGTTAGMANYRPTFREAVYARWIRISQISQCSGETSGVPDRGTSACQPFLAPLGVVANSIFHKFVGLRFAIVRFGGSNFALVRAKLQFPAQFPVYKKGGNSLVPPKFGEVGLAPY